MTAIGLNGFSSEQMFNGDAMLTGEHLLRREFS